MSRLSFLRKRFKYIQACKDLAWKRWSQEYLKALRERHNMKHKENLNKLRVGDVVLIKGDSKNRGKWNIGIVLDLHIGKDGEIRAVKLRVRDLIIERPIQHLYPLELSCDINTVNHVDLDVNAKEFRPRRNAAAIARVHIQDQAEDAKLDSILE